MTSVCIVGAGVTGLSMLLLLHESGIDISNITIIDPHFDGGDISRRWTAVESNTPWSKTIRALQTACPSLALEPPHENTTKLVEIGHLLRKLALPLFKKIQHIQGTLLQANYDSESHTWTLDIQSLGKTTHITSKRLILAPGSDPKTLDLGIPSIPLEIALDATRLQHYVKPTDRVLVFGTMHSGTLVIRNLSSLGADIVAYYNSAEPFYWDRNGDYDGIKAEAAIIADDIVSGRIPVKLVQTHDISNVIRSSQNATWTIYAMGFQPRSISLMMDGKSVSSLEYDGKTGKLKNVPDAWGFGMAYPNLAPDGIHWDVSVAAFLEHMKSQLPDILHS
ncbi:hypothetical protein EBR66_03415 [bacterium]|nr:hypothetical protein [bacterium]